MLQLVTRPVRRALTALGAAVCALALVSALAASAHAASHPSSSKVTPSTPVGRGAGYLALGDSVPFGYMEPTVVPAPDYSDPTSLVGYPEILASELHLKLVNASCPGETSQSFINETDSYACEAGATPSEPAYRRLFPLHVKYSGSQLSYAISYLRHHPGTRLVSLMIGADDYFRCQALTTDQCSSLSEEASVIQTVGKNVRAILTALRTRAHYHGQLVVVDYYATSPALAAGTMELDHFINDAALGAHARVANAYSAFAAASVHSGGSNCTAGLLTQLSTGGCGAHPSLAGQTLLASTVERAIRIG